MTLHTCKFGTVCSSPPSPYLAADKHPSSIADTLGRLEVVTLQDAAVPDFRDERLILVLKMSLLCFSSSLEISAIVRYPAHPDPSYTILEEVFLIFGRVNLGVVCCVTSVKMSSRPHHPISVPNREQWGHRENT